MSYSDDLNITFVGELNQLEAFANIFIDEEPQR